MQTRSNPLSKNRAFYSSITPLLNKLKNEPEITYCETPISIRNETSLNYALVDYVLKIPYTFFEALRDKKINSEQERNKLLSSIYSNIISHYPKEYTQKIVVSFIYVLGVV